MAEWLEIDRYALAMTRQLQADAEADYGRYEFHRVVQALQNLLFGGSRRLLPRHPQGSPVPDGATRAPAARRRAPCGTSPVPSSLMAPILSFTAEAWQELRRAERSDAGNLAALPALGGEAELLAKWALIRAVRGEVTRCWKTCASRARSVRRCRPGDDCRRRRQVRYGRWLRLGDDLKCVFIVSAANVVKAPRKR